VDAEVGGSHEPEPDNADSDFFHNDISCPLRVFSVSGTLHKFFNNQRQDAEHPYRTGPCPGAVQRRNAARSQSGTSLFRLMGDQRSPHAGPRAATCRREGLLKNLCRVPHYINNTSEKDFFEWKFPQMDGLLCNSVLFFVYEANHRLNIA
jgi:hypothetical protein